MRRASNLSRRDEQLMHAQNCFIVAERGLVQAEAWLYVWLLRLAGAPA
jgi:hypothetical protein